MGRKLDLLPKILAYPNWRHRIHLGNDVFTPGYNTIENDWQFYHMPHDLCGKSVLDLGANDGYYSFTALEKGAESVTAADIYWGDGSTMVGGWPIEGIALLNEYFNASLEIVPLSVYDLAQLNRNWDVVFCNDLLSWLNDIPRALKTISASCNETLIIHDTFSSSRKNKDILVNQIGVAKLHRMNVEYLKKKLKSLGFNDIRVKKVYSYKHYEWQHDNFPRVSSAGSVRIFKSPYDAKHSAQIAFENEWGLTEFGEFLFIKNLGWVLKGDVKIYTKRKSVFKKILKYALPDKLFDFWYSLSDREKLTTELVVIAKR